MTDRKGNPVKVGDRVFVLPSEAIDRDGGTGYIRRVLNDKARVDDGPAGDFDFTKSKDWSWSSWCKPNELELVR
jgi:hypothetical protein